MVQDLYILMITAAVVSIVFKLLKQPVVLGYIVAGVLVGPNLFGETLVNGDNVKSWGDIGVLFVLFCIGLEFRLKNLISSGKIAAVGALTIILGMMAMGYLVGMNAGFDMINALFLAGMLCMSSTTIVMKAIDEAGQSKERFVKGATSILIVEDVVAVVLMVLLSSIAIRHQFEGAELVGKVINLAITLAAWFITGILIIPTLIRLLKKHLNDETLIILSLGLCLGMVLTAEEAGFSSALGAFVMGSILAETAEAHRIEKLMSPLKNVFAAIFFISVGMLINPTSLMEYWDSILWVSLVIIVGMIVFATLGCWWGGATMRDSMLTSFSFVQIGEFSFIIASLGTSLNVLNPVIYPIIVASSVVTTFLTPYIMKAAVPCYHFFYNHASASLRAKMDRREQLVAAAEVDAPSDTKNAMAERVRHAVRHTFITKRLVDLFIKNMSAHGILAAIMIGGTTVMTSCSNDETAVRYDASVSVEQSTALSDALNKVRGDMGKTDFQGLTPLASCLNQGTATVSGCEMDSVARAKLCDALKALLEKLCGCGGNSETAQTWQLGDLMQTLQSALNVSLIFEQLADNKFVNNGGYKKSFDFVLSDTLTYSVAYEKERTVETTTSSLTGNILRKLTISKNGSGLLTIETTQDNAAGMTDNQFDFTAAKTGTLCYGDAKFTYERQRQGIQSLVTSLTYLSGDSPVVSIKTKGDNNLSWESFLNREVTFKGNLEFNLINGFVGIVSDVSDLNKFYAAGLAIGAFSVAGTTKDICQKHTDLFNSMVNTHVNMLGLDYGTITYEPVLRDSVSNTYVPALMLTSVEGEKTAIKDALGALGITLENLMQMLSSE